MTTSAFARLGVPAPLCAVLDKAGITEPTPIQAATLPDSLAGRDVLGRGRTGSGKTYAFCLPLVARLAGSRTRRTARRPRAVILAPTRELVGQIDGTLAPLAHAMGLTTLTIFGGVNQNPQVRALANGVDIVVACPGRLEDLMGQKHCDLSAVEVTILDEADHMADLGFLPGVKRIMAATPRDGQRLLFSATLDRAIDGLVRQFLTNPVTHEADSEQSPVGTMTHHVLHVGADDRVPIVADLAAAPGRTVVFTRTKHGAKKLAKQLNAAGVPSVELHGNLSQNARTRNMDAFHSGAATTLVATDIAARGIHVDDVELVVHADPPVEHKAYLHRSGRTARAGADGTVVTLMTDSQVRDVRALTRAAGISATTTRVTPTHPLLHTIAPGERTYADSDATPVAAPPRQPQGQGRRRNGGGSRSGAPRTGGGRGRGGSAPRSAGDGSASRGQSSRGQSSRGRSGAASSARPARSSGGAAGFSARSSAGRRG